MSARGLWGAEVRRCPGRFCTALPPRRGLLRERAELREEGRNRRLWGAEVKGWRLPAPSRWPPAPLALRGPWRAGCSRASRNCMEYIQMSVMFSLSGKPGLASSSFSNLPRLQAFRLAGAEGMFRTARASCGQTLHLHGALMYELMNNTSC